MVLSLPVGAFECDLAIHRIRPPELVREDRDGVTYLAAEDYELAYETTLEFQNGARLPIKGKLFGEQNRQIVIRGSDGAPAQLRGWVRGSIQLFDAREQMIFRGTYFDVDLVIELTGDEDFTPLALRLEHWENGFGEAGYLGHAISLSVSLLREAGALSGHAKGHIG